MFFPNPADVIEALDAATGDFKWRYQREWPDDLMDYLPVPVDQQKTWPFTET